MKGSQNSVLKKKKTSRGSLLSLKTTKVVLKIEENTSTTQGLILESYLSTIQRQSNSEMPGITKIQVLMNNQSTCK